MRVSRCSATPAISSYLYLSISEKIRLILKKLSRIFKILNSTEECKTYKISIVFACFCLNIAPTYAAVFFNSNMRLQDREDVMNNPHIGENLKIIGLIILDVWTTKFYLRIYHELKQVIELMDDFLSYPAFVTVISILASLFWAGYTMVFFHNDDYASIACLSLVIVLFSSYLFMIMLPASSVNESSAVAKEAIFSLPGYIPRHYKALKACVRKRFRQREPTLTLWRIYRIDKPLLISTIGTLVTYGFLVGTLGSVQSSIIVFICSALLSWGTPDTTRGHCTAGSYLGSSNRCNSVQIDAWFPVFSSGPPHVGGSAPSNEKAEFFLIHLYALKPGSVMGVTGGTS
ncbi:uncharacterized protein CEXT_352021 [Caerostris extrusa]|uniref:Gustatory receptor n=1 Tax=Caerostris extrusa TaxID=172846 RepID=A0AAV4QI37_CAEEX|nr:uncharacterized protein CEXT_352021 [Caerostris extrusa]